MNMIFNRIEKTNLVVESWFAQLVGARGGGKLVPSMPALKYADAPFRGNLQGFFGQMEFGETTVFLRSCKTDVFFFRPRNGFRRTTGTARGKPIRGKRTPSADIGQNTRSRQNCSILNCEHSARDVIAVAVIYNITLCW